MRFVILPIILALALLLRVVNLATNPPSLYWDEVGLGYNAYSILTTGKDEHGRVMPFDYFLSFRDYKPPVYVYATVPFVAIFGLNEWSVRLPSALAGTLSVLVTYLLTKELLRTRNSKYQTLQAPNKSQISNSKQSEFGTWNLELVALIASLLFALSPWSIQTSRAAYEANVGQFLTALAILIFLYAARAAQQSQKIILLSLSAFTFALTFYTFNSNRVFTPLIVVTLLVLFWKEILPHSKISDLQSAISHLSPIVIAGLIGLIMIIPLTPHLFSKEGQLRYKEVNIFSNPAPLELSQQRIDRAGNTLVANIFNNRRILYAQEWLSGYFSHFRGDFLFIKGDINPRFSSGDVGQLYLITLPFILIGIYIAATKLGRSGWLIIGWMLLSPVPAAFAREVPHALRTLHILPMFDILASIGFMYSVRHLQNSKSEITNSKQITNSKSQNSKSFKFRILSLFRISNLGFLILAVCAFAAQFFYFQYNYHKYYPTQTADEWQYGYKQMVTELVKIQDQYEEIIVTNEKGRAYINVLFYQQYPPAQFQQLKQYSYDELGLFEVSAFDKYEFRSVDWLKEIRRIQSNDKVLVVGAPSEVKIGKWTKSYVIGLDGKPEYILNEIPQGFENATEQGIFEDLDAYNAFHQTNYTIDKDKRWVISDL